MKITNSNLIAKILNKAKQQASAVSWDTITGKPTIPTALSQLTTDENNQRVSATEKAKTQQSIIFTYTL